MLKRLMLMLMVLCLAACSSSHMLIGQARPPIDPSQVQIYFEPPAGGYDKIAYVETASGSFTYGNQNKTNSVMTKMKKEAAKLGANGILFQGMEDSMSGGSGVSVGGGGGRVGRHSYSGAGVGVNISPQQKYGRGMAIYVHSPQPQSAQPVMPSEEK